MSLLAYQSHASPFSHKDILQKIKVFAVAQGWTLDWEELNVEWTSQGGGVYAFDPGNHDYLQLSSAGYGNQNIRIRIKAEGTGVDPQHEYIKAPTIDPTNFAIDYNSSVDPISQNNVSHWGVSQITQSPAATPYLYLFGNDKIIFIASQMTTTYVIFLMFGSVELFDQTRSDCFGTWAGYYGNGTHKWYEMAVYSPFFGIPGYLMSGTWSNYTTMWGEGQIANGQRCRCSPYLAAGHSDVTYNYWGGNDTMFYKNDWTGKRVTVKPTVFLKKRADDVWEPVGMFPFHYINFQGLVIGQELPYGTEVYKIFPNVRNERKFGCALRIT